MNIFEIQQLLIAHTTFTFHHTYYQETPQASFNAGPTFAGFALLINTAGICITAPFLGHAMDKLNPYVFMAASAFALPAAYWFLGPAPFVSVSEEIFIFHF
mgnify:CR=1 FL=1